MSLKDKLEENLNACHMLKNEYEEKEVHLNFIEDELANAFRKIKNFKIWIKAIENRFDAMCNNSSESNENNESILEINTNAEKKVRFKDGV